MSDREKYLYGIIGIRITPFVGVDLGGNNSIILYLVKRYFIYRNKDGVFMRRVAFGKCLIINIARK